MGLFDGIAGAGANKYQRTGLFDDIAAATYAEQDEIQAAQQAEQATQQQNSGSIIDGIANQINTTANNVANTFSEWGDNVKTAWDNYNYQVGNAITKAAEENGGVVPMVVSDDPEATLTVYGGTDYTNARKELYNEAIGKPAGYAAITPYMPTPIRAAAGVMASPMIIGDAMDMYTHNSEAKANGEAPEGVMGNPVVATVKQFALDPIIDPVTRAASDPSGFIGGIVDNPTNLWNDVFLPAALVKGATPKGLKGKVYEKLPDSVTDRVEAVRDGINDGITDVKERANGLFADIAKRTNEPVEEVGTGETNNLFGDIARDNPDQYITDEYVSPENTGDYTGGYEETGNLQNDIYNRYRAAGFTDVEAAALTGNIGAESSFDTGAVSYDGNGSVGLVQFTGPRKTALENFAAERGLDVNDWRTQIDFSVYELTQGEEKAALQAMRENPNATPEEMAVIVRERYERPDPDVANDAERQRIARATFDGNYGDYNSTPRNGISESGELYRTQQPKEETPHEIVESDSNNSQIGTDKENLNISAKNDLVESDLSHAKDDLDMNTSTDNTNGVRNENKAVFDDLAENNTKKEAISQNIDISPKELADKLKESEDFNSDLEKTSEQKILEYKNQSRSELIDTIKDNIHELRQGVLDPLGDTGKVDFGMNRKTIDGITKQFGLERQTDSISVKRAFATTLVKDTIKSPDIILRETSHDGTSFKRVYVKYWKDTNNVVRSVSVEMTNGEMGRVATNNVDSLARKVEKADAIEYARDKAVNANNTGRDNNTISEDVERLGRPVTRREIINTVNDLFDQRVKSGRLGKSKDVLGWYNRMTEVIRTRNFGDINTLMHELGHHVDHKNGFSIDPKFNAEFSKAVHERFGNVYDKLGDEGIRKEGYAEFFHDYVSDRNKAKADFPTFYDHFTERLARDKELNGAINKLSKVTHEWFRQSPEDRLKGSITFDSDDFVDKTKEAVKNPRKIVERIKKFAYDAKHSPYTTFVDELHPFKQLMDTVREEIGRESPFESDVFKQAWLSRGAMGKAQALVEFGDKAAKVKSLDDIMRIVGKDAHKDFSTYLVARHDLDLHANGQKATFARSEDVAVMRKYENNKTFQKAAKELYKYQDYLLQQLVREGMMTPEMYSHLKQKYPNYVPFFRDLSNSQMDTFLGSRTGFIDVANPIKRMKGSTLDIVDPLESVLRNTYLFFSSVERNKVGRTFAKIADIPGMGKIVERVAEGAASAKDNTFTVWQQGKKVVYETTPELKQALEMYDEKGSNAVIKVLQTPAGWLRAGATSTTGFALANMIRDNISAAIFSKHGYLPVVDTFKGVAEYLKKGDLYQEYMKSGAAGSVMVSLDRDYMGGQIREIVKGRPISINPYEWMRAISEAAETSTRLAEFDNARKGYTGIANRLFGDKRNRLSPEEAALQARDITIDFSRIGKHMKGWNRIAAFLNATIQGGDKLRRTWQEDPLGATIRANLFITIPTIALWYMNKDNPEYQELPQYVKDTYWIIPAGDHLVKIPKPFELGVLYGTSVERMLQWMDDKEKGRNSIGFKGYGARVRDTLVPSFAPTAAIPIAEWMANYSFWRDKNIIPQSMKDLPDYMQYGQNTSVVAKGLGKLFNASPYLIDNTIRGYGGNLATLGLTAIDAATGETANRPAKRWYEMPEINKFTATPYQGSNSVQRVYDDFDAQNKLFNEAKITKQKPEDFDVRQFGKLKEAREQLTKLSRASKAIMNNDGMSGEQKREQLDRLNVLKTNIARRVYGYDRVK